MNERKTININPDLFNCSNKNNTTRKKRNSDGKKELKMKSNIERKEKTTTLKRNLLKIIRDHQDKKYKSGYDKTGSSLPIPEIKASFNSEFDDSLNYFVNLTKNNNNNNNTNNKTIKKPENEPRSGNVYAPEPLPLGGSCIYPEYNNPPSMQSINSAFYQNMNNNDNVNTNPCVKVNYPKFEEPSYGCLKNGNKPTYRIFNNTRKNLPNQNNASPSTKVVMNNPIPNISRTPSIPLLSEMKQTNDKIKNITNFKHGGIINKRHKKISRRTYTVGKSKKKSKISILVSNRTIRNNIRTKTQMIQQASISDVKKYLIKKGMIRSCTVAPNDVLRKMYESVLLICGDINNHNPGNLLYNFMNTSV